MWAEAMGCVGVPRRFARRGEPTIKKANEITDRPVVIDFRTQAEENVYPDGARRERATSEVLVDPSSHREGCQAQ